MVNITGGESGTQQGGYVLETVMIAFLTIGLYNSLELMVQIAFTFKHRRGLYFWSMVIATLGIPFYSVGFILKYWAPDATPWGFYLTIIEIGWVSYVSGQSVLLYSRLHLVLFSRRILRILLAIIIFDGVVLHTITIVATYGSNSDDAQAFVFFYSWLEKLQMTWFSLQEFVISCTYIWATSKLLAPAEQTRKAKMMRHLIYVNIFVIILDIVMLGFVYADSYEIETTIKPAIYTVKMKLEFTVLNQLVMFTKGGSLHPTSCTNEMQQRDIDMNRRSSMRFNLSAPRDRVYSGVVHPAHAGILRTTTVVVGSGDHKSQNNADNPSQDCIISSVPPSHTEERRRSSSASTSENPSFVHAL